MKISMSLKEQVLQMITSIEDEQLLELVKAGIKYFNNNEADILISLMKQTGKNYLYGE